MAKSEKKRIQTSSLKRVSKDRVAIGVLNYGIVNRLLSESKK